MDQSRIGNAVELGNRVTLPASRDLLMDQTSRIISNMRPPETFNQMEAAARPVHNYSMQTGEEFSLEFMRDRINSRAPFAPSTTTTTMVNTLGSTDVKNIVGGPIPKEFERGNSSLTEGKSIHSVPQTASVSSSSAKMKILCSFGGQILPRPSDGKLRYVGGETRMIRISNDISWQELKEKTMEIFKENHIIRYQLPGEDLDALVSVSCDDDLQNMVEEGKDLEGVEEGSKKLRMFLFSLTDLEDADYSLVSVGCDSEVNYVVAVNGMELGSRKQSFVHDLPSTSENNLKEFDGQHFEKYVHGEAAELSGVSTPRTGIIASSSTIQSSQSIQPNPSNMLHTEEAISSHLEESSRHILLHGHTPQDGVTEGHQYDDLQVKQPDSANNDRLKTEDPVQQESDSRKVFSLDNHPSTLSGTQEGSTVDHIIVEEALITQSVPERMHVLPVSDVSLLEDYSSSQHPRCDDNDKFTSTDTAFLPSYAGFGSDLIDLSNNDQPALHQRVFYSEKIPRDQAAILNRLSKSDHSLDSQLLIARPHSDNLWQDSISESIDPLQNRSEAAETEEYFLSMKSLHTESPTVNQGLEQLQSYKMFADKISKTNPKHSGYMSELNPEEYVLNSISDKRVMNDDRALQTDPESFQEDSLKKRALEAGEQVEGGSKQLPVKQDSPVKHQEDPASSLPEIDWGEIGGLNHTGDSNLGLHQPSIVTGSSTVDVPHMETPLDVSSMQEREDTLVDINGRTSDDILSDMFSKSVITNDTSGFGQLNIDGVGLSVNMVNHEPKRWSYFHKLAQDQSLQKEISLIDQDHLGYPYEFAKFKDEGLKSYDFTPLRKDGSVDAQIDSGEDSPREYLHTVGADNTVDPSSNYDPSQVMSEREHENGKQIKNIGLPPVDPSAGDLDFSSLQVIKNGDLEELKELGSGTFGTVYHGKWRGTDVAIKRIKNSCFTGPSSAQEKMATFWGEADIISKLHHPNVVAFYGVVQDGPGGTLATVVEFMVDGSLKHVLLRKDRYLDHHKRLLIAMDAAFGMEYLHSKHIIHFDLKCDNLLVNLKDPLRPICKVGDFGLSKIRKNTLVTGGIRGTLPWMAPELLNGSSNKVSEKVDVFSFGIALWEILTGEEPYANMHYGAVLGGIANNTLRPVIPSYCDDDWRNLMEQCWAPIPAARPSFSQIATRLRTMSARIPTKVQPIETSK